MDGLENGPESQRSFALASVGIVAMRYFSLFSYDYCRLPVCLDELYGRVYRDEEIWDGKNARDFLFNTGMGDVGPRVFTFVKDIPFVGERFRWQIFLHSLDYLVLPAVQLLVRDDTEIPKYAECQTE